MEGWIKLHRSLSEHPIMRDSVALSIFVFLLLHVNRKTGSYRTGRKRLAGFLGLSEYQVYRGLLRLSKRYEIVKTETRKSRTTTAQQPHNQPHNDHTEITLLQWDKYNSAEIARTDTRSIPARKPHTKQEEEKKNTERAQTYLEQIPEQDITHFVGCFNATKAQIVSKGLDLLHYCQAKNKSYSNYRSFLRNALKKDFGEKEVVKKDALYYGQN